MPRSGSVSTYVLVPVHAPVEALLIVAAEATAWVAEARLEALVAHSLHKIRKFFAWMTGFEATMITW